MEDCAENYNCDPPSFKERVFQKSEPETQTQDLKKCLNLFDLTVQGLAHIVGAGIFIMTPGVIRLVAGPGLVLSYLISAVVLIFTVLCYMDLGSRYRGIGNAYVYVYAALGELAASLVSTFTIMELCLSITLIAVGFGQNFDRFLLNNEAHRLQAEYASTFLPEYLAQNVNLIAIAVLIACCGINCIGIRQVTLVNTVVVAYSITSLAMYVIIALIYGNIDTFTDSTDPETGKGGVFPYGLYGVLQGAAVVTVSFAGFETVVSLSAEAKQPKKDVPLATFLAYGISVIIYVIVSFSIAYMVPWYTLSKSTGVPDSLLHHNLTIPMYMMIAALLAASSSVGLCTVTTVARCLLVTGEDGLLFRFLSSVAACSQVPILATILVTFICILISLCFSYDILIHLVSGGALLAFSAVNFATVVISYTRPGTAVNERSRLIDHEAPFSGGEEGGGAPQTPDQDQYQVAETEQHTGEYVDNQDWKVAGLMAGYGKLVTVMVVLIHLPSGWSFWSVRLPLILLLALLEVLVLCYIRRTYYVQNSSDQGFVCPGMPFVPAAGFAMNMVLFSALDKTAHLMTVGYVVSGAALYLGYGYFNSSITLRKRKEFAARNEEL